MSFIGPEGLGDVSVSTLAFPFVVFLSIFSVMLKDPDKVGISGEIEREPVIIKP